MYITADVPADTLAEAIARSGMSHEDLIRFIMMIDDAIAEMDFTINLHDALTEVLKAEGYE